MTSSAENRVMATEGGVSSVSLDESYVLCRDVARRTAGNFYFSFLTLPRDKFRDMCVLYAFMRHTDDLGDDDRMPAEQRRSALDRWKRSLHRALDGEAFDHPVLPALAAIVSRYEIPREHLTAVIDGVAMDLDFSGFETFDDLSRYCYHVAGAVGLCCIRIWGYHDERAVAAAVDCGLAFQLTNILRDLGEDAKAGRVYLPREDLRRFHFTEDDIRRNCRDERFERLMQFEVERARNYYDRARSLFEYLAPTGKPILSAMLGIYGGLLTKIEQRRYDVYSERVRLSRPRKLAIALWAMLRRR
ncbi:MAG: phytoene/squalene synthase family protein [Planctomycetaceae bacterium]